MANRKDRRASGIKNQKQEQIIALLKTARALSHARNKTEADKHYQAAIRLDPTNRNALLDYGLHAYQSGEFKMARLMFTELVKHYPIDCSGLVGLAMTEIEFGERERAFELVERIMSLKPSAQVVAKIGLMYRNDGDLEKAREYLQLAMKLDPEYPTPYFHLNTIKNFSADDEDFANLKKLAAKTGGMTENQKIMLQYALGKAHMDVGDLDASFKHYTEANRLRRASGSRYDMDEHDKYIDSIIRHFDESVVEKFDGKTPAVEGAPQPIFIVGMPRSGSTLVDQILASHPDAVSLGESQYMSRAIPVYINPDVAASFAKKNATLSSNMIAQLTPELMQSIAGRYFAQAAAETSGKKFVIDKMLFNYAWTGLILLAFPGAKIIHTRRDPVDTGFSIWTLMFSDGSFWSYDQKDIARYHLGCDKLMAHWKKIFPGRIIDAVYEDMVEDQEGQSRRLLEFCGMPWDDSCLRFFETKRTVKTSSVGQVRKPIYKDSVKRWKKYEAWLGDMIDTLEAGGYKLR